MEDVLLPRVTLTFNPDVKRVVGGKTYCAMHGLAHMDDRGCPGCNPVPKMVYKNINFTSKRQPLKTKDGMGAWDGKQGRPFIGEVITIHFTGTQADLAAKEYELRKEHGLVPRVAFGE